MNQLENIERMFKDYDDEHVSDTMMFLVRAVRQLAPFYFTRGHFVVAYTKPDDDVLALIGENDAASNH